MKQVLQSLKNGTIELADVPCPQLRRGHLLIQTRASLISAGTERMLIEFGQGNLLSKARAQPDKVRKVLDKMKTDGVIPTLEAVFARLDEPLPLGYCNAGVVVEVGDGVAGFAVGDRVVSNGAHAEMVCVPQNLCARIPAEVTDEAASFTVLGAIGLQGMRLLAPTFGEVVVVTGLGLIGLMTVSMLRANGCRVLGIDVNPDRLALARELGAEVVDLPAGADPVERALAFSQGRGVDGVIITASSKDNSIVRQAAHMCRKRGRIVLVGVVGLELSRSDFYKKELSFQVSCSYGPGRYDPAYEDRGQDYPLPFVRWTEQRNFEAILDALASRRLDVTPLISARIPQHEAVAAYHRLTGDGDALGIVMTYPAEAPPRERTVSLAAAARKTKPAGRVRVGVIGAGNFARMTLLPALKKLPVDLHTIASAGGVTGAHAGRSFGFRYVTSDYRDIIADRDIDLVIILTRHDLHAPMVLEALQAGKHVAVEKPLCLTREQLDEIRAAYAVGGPRQLLVGFNRGFAPHVRKMRELLRVRTQPLAMSMMVNAGVIPPESWVHDPDVGGGRIIGEGCHWIDLMSVLADAPVRRVYAARVGESDARAVRDDKTSITLEFGDGSIGTLHYFGNGAKSYPKETLEVFCDGRVLRLDNFRVLSGAGWPNFKRMRLSRMDKGHFAEFERLVHAIANGGPEVMPFARIVNVMQATFAAVDSAGSGEPVDMPPLEQPVDRPAAAEETTTQVPAAE
ncbi:MAG TPA: bi-domain-containing oxidoreductase [Phycisphaerae bacterium]|nr:bi-domain-containing oxidoreductase [Phycisphaerae bacterium]